MYVCVCNAVTDQAIRDAAAAGVDSLCELTMRTGCGACCGSCLPLASSLLDDASSARAERLPTLGSSASVAIAA